MKNKFALFNILITFGLVLVVLISVFAMTSYRFPDDKDLKTTTGTIEKFSHHEKKWYDYIFRTNDTDSFRIWLRDGTYYEATGINYDNIDKSLYDKIYVGGTITITYNDKGEFSPNDIVSITYGGVCYLSLQEVRREYQNTDKGMKIFGIIAICVSVAAALLLYALNVKKNKPLQKLSDDFQKQNKQ